MSQNTNTGMIAWRVFNIAGMLMAGFFLIHLGYKKYGPLTLEISGEVSDSATRMPVVDAYIFLALGSTHNGTWETSGGCADGSTILKTDSNGRFHYNISKSSKERADRYTFEISAYHMDYSTMDIATYSGDDDPDQSRPADHARNTSLYYEPDGREIAIRMARRETTEWDSLVEAYDIASDSCLHDGADRGRSSFLREIYLRAWINRCSEQSIYPAEAFDPMEIGNFLESLLYGIDTFRSGQPDTVLQRKRSARSQHVMQALLSGYPRPVTSIEMTPEALTMKEIQAFCSFYGQPIDNLLNQDTYQ